jgi:hypothetical protein
MWPAQTSPHQGFKVPGAGAAGATPGLACPGRSLTTFAHVPWNAPSCARCRFGVLDDAGLTPGLRVIGQREAAPGLDRWHAP